MATQMLLPLLLGWVVSGLATGVGVWLSRRVPATGSMTSGNLGWIGAVSFASGYAAGHVLLRGWPPFPARDRADCLFYLTLAAAALQIGLNWRQHSPVVTWLFRGAFWLAAVFWLLPKPTSPDGIGWAIGLTVAGWLWWLSLDRLAAHLLEGDPSEPRSPSRSAALSEALPLAIVLAGSMIVTLLSGTAQIALLQGVMLAALTPQFGMAFWRRQASPLLQGSLQILAVVLPGTWIIVRFYSEVPLDCALLLWSAPFVAWISQTPPVKRSRPWEGAVVVTAVTALIVGLAVGITVLRFLSVAPDTQSY